MDHLTERSLVLTLVFTQPDSRFRFQMDEEMAETFAGYSDIQYINYRVQEIQQQNPNTILKQYQIVESHKAPKPQK